MLRKVGLALDIDGCVVLGRNPIPGAVRALSKLEKHKVPYVFVTNGGGCTERVRAERLSTVLGMPVNPSRMILSHSPLRSVVQKQSTEFRQGFTLIAGHGDLNEIGDSLQIPYVTVEELHALQPLLYPFITPAEVPADRVDLLRTIGIFDQPIKRVFLVHDSVHLTRDVQIILDVLRSQDGILNKPLHGYVDRPQALLWNTNEDVVFAGRWIAPRIAQAAFEEFLQAMWRRVNLESVRTEDHDKPHHARKLVFSRTGKPHRITYEYAEDLLERVAGGPIEAFYGVGDNPRADVRGANRAGDRWKSVLVRTGCFQGPANDPHDPAHMVTADVEEAVDRILSAHC
eukprot:ANDGO_06962.mRNA.1 putative CDP-alcohol phosphatidyltransferase class-I family protein C22A12.08c